MWRASSALTGRPVRIMSIAREKPIKRGSRNVPPSISGTPAAGRDVAKLTWMARQRDGPCFAPTWLRARTPAAAKDAKDSGLLDDAQVAPARELQPTGHRMPCDVYRWRRARRMAVRYTLHPPQRHGQSQPCSTGDGGNYWLGQKEARDALHACRLCTNPAKVVSMSIRRQLNLLHVLPWGRAR